MLRTRGVSPFLSLNGKRVSEDLGIRDWLVLALGPSTSDKRSVWGRFCVSIIEL
jgi:hypothetical protein